MHRNDLRHETFVRVAPVIIREGGAAEAGELHISGFKAFEDDEIWVALGQLQVTPESAHRLVRQLNRVLTQLDSQHEGCSR